MDFSITSPPNMDEEANDFTLTSHTTKGNYEDYLDQISAIYTKIRDIMKKKSTVIVEVSNLKNKNITTLAK